jgi:uncharacterized membrane protein YfcA
LDALAYGLMAVVASAVGALGGLGGAVILVPALVISGLPAAEAVPLGLISVAAGSVAAGAHQLTERTVNHRLGVTTELLASTGAVAGALLSGVIGDRSLTLLLAGAAVAAAVAGLARGSGLRNPPDDACRPSDVGERVGLLSGAYPPADSVVPYTPRRMPAGLSLMALAGLVAGMAGASGGFIKTPATSEIMGVPMRVAAATTTFTVGITSSAALVVFAVQGRIDPRSSAAVILGSLAGGRAGARFQARLHPTTVRRTLSVLLLVIAVVLVVRS